MPDKLFIVKVRTSGPDDDDVNLTDHFAKTLAINLASTAYRVIDVSEARSEPRDATSPVWRAGWRAALQAVANGNAVDV